MARTIVAMFDSRTEAERAVDALANAGYSRGDIQIRSEPWHAGETRTESTSWWEWLFGESDERASYNEGLQRGGAVLSVTTPDDKVARVREILEARGGDVTTGTTAERVRREGREKEVIPVVEERLKVGKRPIERGGVRVFSRVTERPVTEDVHLRDERVRVERHPVDRPVSAATDDAFRERWIEVIESSEEAVIAKEARVVEEVVVGKEARERVEQVRDTVRRTDVQIQNIDAPTPRHGELMREHDADFRQHWNTRMKGSGTTYEQCQSAYGYGCDLGGNVDYANRDWAAVEPEARRRWEERNPGTWDKFKEPVQYSWDRVRSRRRAA